MYRCNTLLIRSKDLEAVTLNQERISDLQILDEMIEHKQQEVFTFLDCVVSVAIPHPLLHPHLHFLLHLLHC